MSDRRYNSRQQGDPFEGILHSFGTSVPQVSTIAAIVIGSLQFDAYFNAGAWAVVAVLCFSFVFLYRRQVPRSLPRSTVWVLLFIAVLSCPIVAFSWQIGGIGGLAEWTRQNSEIASAYASFITTTSIAILITSYQNQEKLLGRSFPKSIETAVASQLHARAFYKEHVIFETTVVDIRDERVLFRMSLQYDVVNRTGEEQMWMVQYKLSGQDSRVVEVLFNEESIDLDQIDHHTGRGIEIYRPLQANSSANVYVKAEQWFRSADTELFTSYHPATDISVIADDPMGKIFFDFEPLYFGGINVTREGTRKKVTIASGILPFQGIRLNWKEV